MPVIWDKLKDPTDLVIQGEQFRVAAIGSAIGSQWPMIDNPPEYLPLSPQVLVAGEQNILNMTGSYPVPPREILGDPFSDTLVRNNAMISTPCGALIPIPIGLRLFDSFVESTARFTLTGVTRDSAGTALGNCRVVVHETGRLAVSNPPPIQFYSAGNPNPATWGSTASMVGETISDGSGNYSVPVPMNTAYQATGYKAGSPDVAGITRNDITPSQV